MKLRKYLLIVGALLFVAAVFLIVNNFHSILHRATDYVSKKFVLKGFDENFLAEYYSPAQQNLDIRHYDLHLDLYPDKKIISSRVEINGRLIKPAKEIYLNFYDNFSISGITLNGKRANFENEGTHLKVFSNDLLNDTFAIVVKYSGKPKSLGFGSFEFGEVDGKSLVYSLSEPVFASTWFPCNDLPTDKALADIYITNDSSDVSVSNGILVGQALSGGRKTYHWKTLYPVSTYLIAIYSAEYKSFSGKFVDSKGDTLPLTYYVMPDKLSEAKIDFKDHDSYLAFFERIFGEYPFMKEKYGVAEFLWNSGAMENQTITGIGSVFITGKKFFSDMLVHELAHQWWGNAVTPKTWKDIWLNEGFATYSEALYWEHKAGKNALSSTMQSFFGDFEYGTLCDPSADLFSRMIYNKGAWVLHMLRREVGDSTFFKILKDYYQFHKYKNASTEDFKEVCEEVSGKDLKYFFDEWVFKGIGIPNIIYNWGVDSVKNKYNMWVKISQEQKSFHLFKFPIDIRIFVGDQKDFVDRNFYVVSRDTTFEIGLKQRSKRIDLDPESWLLATIYQEKQK